MAQLRFDGRGSVLDGHGQRDGLILAKSPRLYVILLGVWAMLLVPLVFVAARQVSRATLMNNALLLVPILVLNTTFIAYFWLNGVKDVVYVVFHYLLNPRPKPSALVPTSGRERSNVRVALLYCTCDDFNAASLKACLGQTHENSFLVILDDSKTEAMKSDVDRFAAAHGARVIRRDNSVGYKAGNLNHGLALLRDEYDYFVILDSDEITPKNFVERTLDYMDHYANVGIVQATHIATRNRTRFQKLYARGVDSHWPVYQSVKDGFGFMSLLGHGAIVRREAYEAAGGFPHLVAEDLCLALEMREHGWFVAFADDVVCEEEYPPDFSAFKKRHSKWTAGNMEFITQYTPHIMRSKALTWFEKLDIVLFTYNLPLTTFFALYIVMNVIALPLARFSLRFPAWMLAPTLLFLLAPMANDIIFHRRETRAATLLWYSLHTFLLYGAMFFVSLHASFRGMFGAKAVFIVTPRNAEKLRLPEAIKMNYRELAFSGALIAIATLTTGSPIAVGMITLPSILSVYLTMITAQPPLRRTRVGRHVTGDTTWEEFLEHLELDSIADSGPALNLEAFPIREATG